MVISIEAAIAAAPGGEGGVKGVVMSTEEQTFWWVGAWAWGGKWERKGEGEGVGVEEHTWRE